MKKLSESMSEMLIKTLDKVLKLEANSTSCLVVYQPKMPEGLERFKNKK